MVDPQELPEYAARNRSYWDELATGYAAAGERSWAQDASWGIWHIPESDLHLLDGAAGLDAIELGCGTAYVSAWLARRGARPVGIDNSPRQLDTAARLQREHGIDFPLLLGNAERVPYPDASFNLAISEYGACLWADPYIWVPEAARLLRPGGRLVFLTNGYVLMLCAPDEDVPVGAHLVRSSFGMHRFEWPDDASVEFHLNHGDWVRLLRASGFEILDLLELQAPVGATTGEALVTSSWAQRWPSEEVWICRKRSSAGDEEHLVVAG
jgi:SAM-dependent methyltransferase